MSYLRRENRLAARQLFRAEMKKDAALADRVTSLRGGFTSEFWRLYDLDRNDPSDYLSNFQRTSRTRYFNSLECARTVTNKLLAHQHFWHTVGPESIPCLVGVWHRSTFLEARPDGTFRPFAPADRHHLQDCIMKPVNGDQGRDVVLIEDVDRVTLPTAESYLIQERVHNCEELAKIWPHSLNTLRILVANLPDGEPVVIGAALRFGATGTAVADNFTQGGISVDVKMGSPTLGVARMIRGGAIVEMDKHPDSGQSIRGVEVPGMAQAFELAKRAQSLLPGANWVGWDVAVSPSGPIILEGNTTPMIRLIEVHGGIFTNPLARALFDELSQITRR